MTSDSIMHNSARYNSPMRLAPLLMLFFLVNTAVAVESLETASPAISLTELAARSDLVVLAQARDADYLTRRDIPVSGSAYLRVLIPYKGGRKDDIIEIYEKGLHENECYFPNPTVFEEGRRYLLFLQSDPDEPERYRGLPEGCALEVLVDSENRYALRYPVAGILLSDPLAGLARPMTFSDGYARVSDDELSPAERNTLRDAGFIVADGDGQWLFTQGVELTAVRQLIAPEALAD